MSSSPAALAGGHLDALAAVAPGRAGGVPAGLLEALSQVPDPRDRRGVRYPFLPVLAMAVCATLAGARSFTAIAEWAGDIPAELRAALGLPGPAPGLVTIWRVLTAVDPAALDQAVGCWLTARLASRREPGKRAVLAVDGKTLRGARTRAGAAPHLMACLDHASGVVCAQVAVDGKTNEITMLAPLLDQIGDLDGALITADALHAQREHATYLRQRGAHYWSRSRATSPACTASCDPCPGKTSPPGTPRPAGPTAGSKNAWSRPSPSTPG